MKLAGRDAICCFASPFVLRSVAAADDGSAVAANSFSSFSLPNSKSPFRPIRPDCDAR